MKYVFALFFLLIVGFSIQAQNYAPVYANRIVHYFADSPSTFQSFYSPHIIGLRTDSFTLQSQDTIIYGYNAEPNVFNSWTCYPADTALQGHQIIKSQQFTYFFNKNLDSIRFKHSGKVGDGWKFFDLDNDSTINAYIYRKDTITLNGIVDSVTFISLKMSDSVGTNVIPVNSSTNDTLMVSKRFGLLNFKSWSNYPDTNFREQTFRFNIAIPTRRVVYNYDVGDIFHYSQSSGSLAPPSHSNITILNKWHSALMDTVFYDVHFLGEARTVDLMTNPPTVTYYRNQSYDTIYFTNLDEKILNGVFGEMNLHEGYHGAIFNLAQISPTNRRVSLEGRYGYFYDSTNVCYNLSGEERYYGYGEGIGRTWNYARNGGVMNPYLNERLIFYQKGNETWGIPYNINIGNIEWDDKKRSILVYPNPTKNQIHVQGAKTGSIVRLFDLNGRLLLSQQSEPDLKIDLNDQEKGFYLLEIEFDGKRIRKKVIKN